MASVSGTSSSNSLYATYGNANAITGLASGLDTEGMIEQAVSGYQTKIDSLQQQQTSLEWKQDAYRSIISKMVSMNNKYTSYTSTTNLYSEKFYSDAVKTETAGKNAAAVSATGKTDSEIVLTGVKQLAVAARYRVDGNATALRGAVKQNDDGSYTLNNDLMLGTLLDTEWDRNGETTLKINGTDVTLKKTMSVNDMLNAINKSDAGVTAAFSNLTGQFAFTNQETGADGNITFDTLGNSLFKTGEQKLGDILGSDLVPSGNVSFKFGSSKMTISGVTANTTLSGLVGKLNEQLGATKLAYDADSDSFSIKSSTRYESLDEINVTVNGNAMKLSDILKGKSTTTEGQDAIAYATVNGKDITIQRASNTIDMDGMSVTLMDTFNEENDPISASEAVTFTSKADTEKIANTLRSFVNDYNALVKEIHDAYTTRPLEKSSSSHEKYKPLTDSDKAELSDSAIASYEAKAKTGLLFGDSDLSTLYDNLRSMIQSNQAALKEIGITTKYENYLTTLELNENDLATALDADQSAVRDAFLEVKTSKDAKGNTINMYNDSEGNGINMAERFRNLMNKYASTSSAGYGILVKKAGASESSLSQLDNTLQKQISNLDDKIDSWKDKLSGRIDYYSRMFSRLETLISNYDNQSSMLYSMMGG